MWKDAFPCKIKRIFLVNVPAVFSWSIRAARVSVRYCWLLCGLSRRC